MDAILFQKVKEIFAAAIEYSGDERLALLNERCGSDETLRAEVESLLSAHGSPSNLIEANAFDLLETLSPNKKNYAGLEFGRYCIVSEIGQGGMGAVFLASRVDGEFEQQVALKIVRQTIVSDEIERHFRRERQILASLNHPNIAHLIDGGVSAAGELFLVMEYIEGVDLFEFARDLSVTEKLRLFLKVCGAVEYAHRNLVVHRDLKPSNILVTKDGEPKLLDFGLAKIQNENFAAGLAGNSTQTTFLALTPAYASPEQLRGGTVTTVSDIYSLGVVLYEFLSGEKPFHFENKSLEEILRTITVIEPRRLGQVQNPKMPAQDLKGDLENITAMALRIEPERRYLTVAALAGDIERYLNSLPVSARPNTVSYRASKYFRRNKIAAIAGLIVLLTVFAGGITSFVLYRKAETERAKAEEVNRFLQRMLLTANPEGSKGYSATVNDALSGAADRLETDDFAGQPEVKAELEHIIGTTYVNQGQYDLGEKYLQEALKREIETFGEKDNRVLLTRLNLGNLYLAKADYNEAESIYTVNLPALREECRLGNMEFLLLVRVLSNYALIRRARGDSKQAEVLYRENLALISQNESLAQTKNYTIMMVALTQFDQGKFDEAEGIVRTLIAETDQSVNKNDVETANTLTLLGSILTEKENLAEAQENLIAAENIYRRFLSPNAIAIFDNLRLQAQASYLAGNYPEAEKQIDRVLENYRQNANEKYISFTTALTLQGLILNKLGHSDKAETILREAVRLRTENLPAGHFLIALTKGALGEVLTANKKFDEAEPLLRESQEDLRSQATENQRTLVAKNRLVQLYKTWNRPASDTQ